MSQIILILSIYLIKISSITNAQILQMVQEEPENYDYEMPQYTIGYMHETTVKNFEKFCRSPLPYEHLSLQCENFNFSSYENIRIQYENPNERDVQNYIRLLFQNCSMQKLPINLFDNSIFKNIEMLEIRNCNMKTVFSTFDKFPHYLRKLAINNTKLQYLPTAMIRNFTSLIYLNITFTNINKLMEKTFNIYEDGYCFVKELILYHNQIETIETNTFAHLKSLKVLNLSNNKLSDLNFLKGLNKIRDFNELYLSHNNIRLPNDITTKYGFNFSEISLNNLHVLDLSYNEIETIPRRFFQSFNNIEKLSLKNNRIQRIDEIAFNTLNTFLSTSLKFLDLSHNYLKELKSELIMPYDLLYLYLNNNQIKTINCSFFTAAIEMDLSNNLISECKCAQNCGDIHAGRIDLSNNQLRNFSIQCSGNIFELSLANNLLEHVDIGKLKIGTMNFENNTLKAIHASTDKLSLQNNSVLDTSLLEQTIVSYGLDLSANRIRQIVANTLLSPTLKVLNISHNELITLPFNGFWNLTQLEVLDVSFNRLIQFDGHSIYKLMNLKYLYLDGNRLTEFDYDDRGVIKSNVYLNLGITQNLWNCTYLYGMIKALYFRVKLLHPLNHEPVTEKNVYGIECYEKSTEYLQSNSSAAKSSLSEEQFVLTNAISNVSAAVRDSSYSININLTVITIVIVLLFALHLTLVTMSLVRNYREKIFNSYRLNEVSPSTNNLSTSNL